MPSQRVVVFGATGTIGKAVVAALAAKYEVNQVGNRQGEYKAGLADADSLRTLFKTIGKADGIISTSTWYRRPE
jgi:uncharacterized protein YbjT (DUF2867 family)